MMFLEKYEAIIRMIDNTQRATQLFDTYDEANDAALLVAMEKLPEESVVAYQVNRVYVNEVLLPS